MATRGGARCLGRDDIGSLEPGKAADLIFIDTRRLSYAGAWQRPPGRPRLQPFPEPVDTVIVNGRVVVEGGQLRGVDVPGWWRRPTRSPRRCCGPPSAARARTTSAGPSPRRKPPCSQRGLSPSPGRPSPPLLRCPLLCCPLLFLFVRCFRRSLKPRRSSRLPQKLAEGQPHPRQANRKMRAATVKWRPACALEASEATTVLPASKTRWPSLAQGAVPLGGGTRLFTAPVDLPNLLDLQALDLGGHHPRGRGPAHGGHGHPAGRARLRGGSPATAGLLPAACRAQSPSRMVRGMATLAGEAVEGAPDSAVAAALLALNAIFVIAHPDEPRESPALRFVRQPLDDLRGGGPRAADPHPGRARRRGPGARRRAALGPAPRPGGGDGGLLRREVLAGAHRPRRPRRAAPPRARSRGPHRAHRGRRGGHRARGRRGGAPGGGSRG